MGIPAAMPAQGMTAATYARKLLFELQRIMESAENIGVDTSKTRDIIKKASVSSRIGTEAALRDMINLLNKGREMLEKAITDLHTAQLALVRREIESKRDKMPSNHYIHNAYAAAVNAMRRRDYDEAHRNIAICTRELAKVLQPVARRSYQKFFAKDLTPCNTCKGKVKVGFPVVRCICGKTHHETCASREGKCVCGVKFGAGGKVE